MDLIKNIGVLQTPAGSFAHRGPQQGQNLKLCNAAVLVEDLIQKAHRLLEEFVLRSGTGFANRIQDAASGS